MSLGVALDVAIGLFFLYLLLSLFAAAAQELVAQYSKKRFKNLMDGLRRVLADGSGGAESDLFGALKEHPLITNAGAKTPSYIPARNFSLALIDVLRQGSEPPCLDRLLADEPRLTAEIDALPDSGAKTSLRATLVTITPINEATQATAIEDITAQVANLLSGDQAKVQAILGDAKLSRARKFSELKKIVPTLGDSPGKTEIKQVLEREVCDAARAAAIVADLRRDIARLPEANQAGLLGILSDQAYSPTSPANLAIEVKKGLSRLPDGLAKETLMALLIDGEGQLDKFQTRVETWFDDAMDRVAGFYKQWAQYFALGFGLVAAVIFNVDSIEVAKTLWRDPVARAALVAGAQQQVRAGLPATPTDEAAAKAQLKAIGEQIEKLPLPIGWNGWGPAESKQPGWRYEEDINRFLAWTKYLVATLAGWLITGLAVSLGAPFWFDILKLLVNVRAAGPKPARSAETVAGEEKPNRRRA